jgi:AcrR family transcriptional regulator
MSEGDARTGTDPTAGLSPTARRLVTAARTLLARGGFEALTVEAVAAEAGAYRDSVRYHFGSKAAFVAAVVDSLAHEQSLAAVEKTRGLPAGAERVHALVAGDRQLVEDRDAFRDFFALLPHVVMDGELRARVAALYDWYRELYAAGIADRDEAGVARLRDLASLMVAMTDGLAVQELLDPDGARLDRVFRLWEELLRREVSRG